MELDNFIIEQVIMPDVKPAYRIIFVNNQYLDDHRYFKELSYEERLSLRPYFMEIGGHWSEAHKSFVFLREISTTSIRETIQKANNKMPLSQEQKEREILQAYFTPPNIAKRMQDNVKISEQDIILDPSAGIGNLVDGLTVPKDNIFLVEPNTAFCELLKRKGYTNVIQSTFEEAIINKLLPSNVSKILINPPFSKQRDLKHVLLAYDILAKGGTLVGIIGKNSLLERDMKNQKSLVLEEFIKKYKSSKVHKMIELEAGSFEESGTICDTYMIILEKERTKEIDLSITNNINGEER